jgi:cytidine deaminase
MKLIEAGISARERAHAPYSNYKVGAALLGADGNVYTGCNVENASYGLTTCAERAAVFAMVAAGCKSFAEMVVVTSDGRTPCGACRQVLLEFCESDAVVHVATPTGVVASHSIAELLPKPFSLESSEP